MNEKAQQVPFFRPSVKELGLGICCVLHEAGGQLSSERVAEVLGDKLGIPEETRNQPLVAHPQYTEWTYCVAWTCSDLRQDEFLTRNDRHSRGMCILTEHWLKKTFPPGSCLPQPRLPQYVFLEEVIYAVRPDGLVVRSWRGKTRTFLSWSAIEERSLRLHTESGIDPIDGVLGVLSDEAGYLEIRRVDDEGLTIWSSQGEKESILSWSVLRSAYRMLQSQGFLNWRTCGECGRIVCRLFQRLPGVATLPATETDAVYLRPANALDLTVPSNHPAGGTTSEPPVRASGVSLS